MFMCYTSTIRNKTTFLEGKKMERIISKLEKLDGINTCHFPEAWKIDALNDQINRMEEERDKMRKALIDDLVTYWTMDEIRKAGI